GNPNLLPEYTDSYETGAIFIFDKISFNTNVYYRYTTEKVERVSTFKDGVTFWTPQNIGTNKATGIEVNFKYSPIKKLVLNGDANYNLFVREGSFNNQDFDFSANQWFGKLSAKYKISKALDTELTTRYESAEQTIQGIRAANLFADFGLKYKILDGKGVFNFSVRDIFASRIRQMTIDQPDFYTYSFGQRGRFITLGFSYGFGKGEAMQYAGSRRR
ncbi:MAG: TonB-dependent receptor domain-containing protein, partial [Chitinophagales bacterium]